MSDDGDALVIEHFDLTPQGGYLGLEDFCVLNGINTGRKYEGCYEIRLFKRA
jgi:serine/threonine-protein kinase HipA